MSFHLQYGTVCYHYIGNYIPQSHPINVGCPVLMTAISPRRRRMAPSSRSRTIFSGNGSLTLGSTRTCTNSTHPIPLIKVLRSFFKSDRSLPFRGCAGHSSWRGICVQRERNLAAAEIPSDSMILPIPVTTLSMGDLATTVRIPVMREMRSGRPASMAPPPESMIPVS